MVLIVRDDAIPRMKALAGLMRWHYKYAKATVEELWTNSQACGQWEGSAEDVVFWAGETDARAEIRQKLVQNLQNKRVRFITKKGDDLYEIHGNKTEVTQTERRRETNRENANKRWDVERAKAGKVSESQSPAKSERDSELECPPQCDSHAESMRGAMPKLNQAKLNQAELNEPEDKEKVAGRHPPPSEFDLELADLWTAHAREQSPTSKPNRASYADAVRRLRADGLSEPDIRGLLTWVRASDFWRDKTMSPAQLFKRRDQGGPRKLDTIRAQMQQARSPPRALPAGVSQEQLDERMALLTEWGWNDN